MKPVKLGELEVAQDLEYEKKLWKVERTGWIIMMIIIFLALIGLLGTGPLSHTEYKGTHIGLQYDRFQRRQAPETLRLSLDGSIASEGRISFSLNKEFIEDVENVKLEPEPDIIYLNAGGYLYTFNSLKTETLSDIFIYYEPRKSGILRLTIKIPQKESISVNSWVYP